MYFITLETNKLLEEGNYKISEWGIKSLRKDSVNGAKLITINRVIINRTQYLSYEICKFILC